MNMKPTYALPVSIKSNLPFEMENNKLNPLIETLAVENKPPLQLKL